MSAICSPIRPRARVLAGLLVTALTLIGIGATPAHGQDSVVATIAVGDSPYGIALSGDGSTAYVANFNSGTISVLDTSTRTVTSSIPLSPGVVLPVLSPDGSRLYVTNPIEDKVYVIDTSTNTKLSEIAVSDSPSFMAVTPNGSTGYVSRPFVGEVAIVNLSTEAVTSITLGGAPIGVAVNPAGTRLYVADSVGNKIDVFDTGTNAPITSILVELGPEYVLPSPDGTRLYVANRASNNVSEINTATNTVTRILTAGNQPNSLAINPGGNRLYVANLAGNDVSVVDLLSGETFTSIPVGDSPFGTAISPDGELLYVTNAGSNSVSVIDTNTIDPETSASALNTYAEFSFFLPDGRECSSISPQRVQVGTMVQLPGETALCQTSDGSTVAGWSIPVPHGFTGYGSESEPFPPGLPVRVVGSQRFTLVPFEPVVTTEYDANIAASDSCTPANLPHASDDGRIGYSWVPRVDFAAAHTWSQAPCAPTGYELAGWNTRGDGTGDTIELGALLPADWHTSRTNTYRLYAVWRAV